MPAGILLKGDALLLIVLLLGVLLVAAEFGFRMGRRRIKRVAKAPTVEVIQSALLTLLSLLLAFSISMAEGWHQLRVQHMLHEANAIGTAYLRADLAAEPLRAGLRA